jgi:molybdopterin synthase sulfur carrier subunit
VPAQAIPVAIPTPLRSYTGGAAEVTVRVDGAPPTLADVFAALDAAHPGIRFRMIDEAGRVRPHVQVFIDGVIERNLGAALVPGARVMLVGARSGC